MNNSSLLSSIKSDSITINDGTPPALVSEDDSKTLITKTANHYNVSPEIAYTAICIICQKGGTAKKAQGTIYANVNGTKIELQMINQIKNQNGLKFTLRQWARTYATTIYTVCSHFSIPGDLAKKLGRHDPSLTTSDLIWMSNFQMDNQDAPQKVKDLLLQHYNSLFKKEN